MHCNLNIFIYIVCVSKPGKFSEKMKQKLWNTRKAEQTSLHLSSSSSSSMSLSRSSMASVCVMRAEACLTHRAILAVSLLTLTCSSSAFLSLRCCSLSSVTILLFSSPHSPASMPRTSSPGAPPTRSFLLLAAGALCGAFLGEKGKQHAWRGGGGDREPSSSLPLFRSLSVGRPRPAPKSRSMSSSSSPSSRTAGTLFLGGSDCGCGGGLCSFCWLAGATGAGERGFRVRLRERVGGRIVAALRRRGGAPAQGLGGRRGGGGEGLELAEAGLEAGRERRVVEAG
uniref:Uncharacterized protein n=1 Tax=Triticum urartu TaxID=4572 RepID=A0A8R7V9K5_TRIUA